MKPQRALLSAQITLLALSLLGCGGSGSVSSGGNFVAPPPPVADNSQPPAPTATVLTARQNVSVQVQMTFTEPDEATNFSLEVFDVATGKRLAGPVLFQRLPGAGIPDQVISGLDGSAFRVVVEATTSDGRAVGTLDRTLPADSQLLTFTFATLPLLPATAEIGRISVSSLSGDSNEPAISRDGRFVAFSSVNPGLLSGILPFIESGTTGTGTIGTSLTAKRAIFLRDRQTSTTQRIDLTSRGSNQLFVAADGTSNTILVGENQAAGGSRDPDLSADGRFLTFERDIFGSQIAFIDRNGFAAQRDITPVQTAAGTSFFQVKNGVDPSISENGRFVTYTASITDQPDQIALWDRDSLSTSLISKTAGGVLADRSCANPIFSPDGKLIFFSSTASNLSGGQGGLFVYDINSDTFARLSSPSPFPCSVSDDGRFVTANIDNRLRLIDRQLNTNIEVPGLANFAAMGAPSISGNGRFITFYSSRTDLVGNDANGRADVFVIDLTNLAVSRVNVSNDGVAVSGGVDSLVSQGPVISKDASRIAFASPDDLLFTGDLNGSVDVFSSANPTAGKLYAVINNRIFRYDNFASANGVLTPAAQMSNVLFPGSTKPELFLDTQNDRLYVSTGTAANGRVLYFDKISKLDGDVVFTRFRSLGANSPGLFVDVGRDLLYRGNVVLTASTLSAPLRTITGEKPTQVLVDTRFQEWILGGFGSLRVFSAGTATANTPLRVLPTNLGNLRGMQFDSSPVGTSTRNDSNYFLVSEGASVGSTPDAGFNKLGQFSPGGSLAHLIFGNLTGLGNFSPTTTPSNLAVDAFTGHTYCINGADSRVLVFHKPTQDAGNKTPDRVLTLTGIPQAIAIDRTR